MTDYGNWLPIARALRTQLVAALGTASGASYTILDANFKIRKRPRYSEVTVPMCFIFLVDDTRAFATVTQDDVGYGIGIAFVKPTNQDNASEVDIDTVDYWRRVAITTLGEQRIDSVGVFRIVIEPRSVIDEGAFRNMVDVSSFVARAFRREGV